jgi:hypothetical protein
MADTFLPRDPAKAIAELRDRLYDRLNRSRQFIDQYGSHLNTDRVFGVDQDQDLLHKEQVGFDRAVKDEILFLERLLDEMERS